MQALLSLLFNLTRIITSPFTMLARALGITSAQNQAASTRNAFSALNSRLGGVFPKGSPLADFRDSMEARREERDYARQEKADVPVIYRPGAADYSQIHLVSDRQRLVLHIGATTHSTQADFVLREATNRPLTLSFRRVNDAQFGAPFTLTITGDCEAAVNGRTITGETPVLNRSKLTVDDDEFVVEFLAWQALPFAPRMEVGWYTGKGPVRHINEDAIGLAKTAYGQFFAVADGVGGGEGGELVSEFVIRYMLTVFERNIRYDFDWLDLLRQAFSNMNQEVRRFGMQSQALSGTTLTMVILRGWDAYVGHIGDSRLYLVSGGEVSQITTDHVRTIRRAANGVDSLVPTQLERNVLLKAIGKADMIEPQLTVVRLQPGDHLLLMTDGAATRLQADELGRLVKDYRVVTLAEHLAMTANERFNADNLSIVHVHIKSTDRRSAWKPVASERVYTPDSPSGPLRLNATLGMNTNYQRMQRRRRLLIWLVLLVILGIVLAAVIQTRRETSAALDALTTATETMVTPSLMPTASATRRPVTATTIPTLTITPTAIPPTSTLAPLPTSTLALPRP